MEVMVSLGSPWLRYSVPIDNPKKYITYTNTDMHIHTHNYTVLDSGAHLGGQTVI